MRGVKQRFGGGFRNGNVPHITVGECRRASVAKTLVSETLQGASVAACTEILETLRDHGDERPDRDLVGAATSILDAGRPGWCLLTVSNAVPP